MKAIIPNLLIDGHQLLQVQQPQVVIIHAQYLICINVQGNCNIDQVLAFFKQFEGSGVY